uniref:Uncharacterized protein n=1 Tax=Desertifilum tharense IPPAS B-1220 TaxID=1781255 RepID=A0ACD5GWT1_9CYAN
MLRTRDRAVTPEDFEALTLQAGMGAVARTRCLSATERQEAGTVRLLIVPQANTDAIAMGMGIHPERFALTPQLQDRILAYLNERRLLGIQVKCIEPNYVGVSVQTEVALEPAYNNPQAQEEILFNLRVALYRFLNPLTGGSDGKGWYLRSSPLPQRYRYPLPTNPRRPLSRRRSTLRDPQTKRHLGTHPPPRPRYRTRTPRRSSVPGLITASVLYHVISILS